MDSGEARVTAVSGNMVTISCDGPITQNGLASVNIGGASLKGEVIRVRGDSADLQVFEDTTGIRAGDTVQVFQEMFSVELGPGLLGMVYDGLQNPLFRLAEESGFFLERGKYIDALDREREWFFEPSVSRGDELTAGETLGTVKEGMFTHRIMVPFSLTGSLTVREISKPRAGKVPGKIASLVGQSMKEHTVSMIQRWPAKVPLQCYKKRLKPEEQLMTNLRIIDTFFPVSKGGTYCIPGPFGAGKTVLQQLTSKNADVDIVVIAACGERAGEVVETLREFPNILDPRTGRSLMERTVLICNTSSMPVSAREASVYTAVTISEYYRQMGLHVLLLADSTSRWAQALREMSGRLEEIPGEEAFPAYLESLIAAFYERSGMVTLKDGSTGSVTIGGTVSPAGGNFEEPVTQATLKVVGAFHGLSRARSDARRYPAIHPLESWSRYKGIVSGEDLEIIQKMLTEADKTAQMMKVVGEEGVSLDDFIQYLKGEFLDAVYLQQDAFHDIDGKTPAERQKYTFSVLSEIMRSGLIFENRKSARSFFHYLTQLARDWNHAAMNTAEFKNIENKIAGKLSEVTHNAQDYKED